MVNDKDIDTVLALLPTEAVYYFTQPATSRALPAEELLRRWQQLHPIANTQYPIANRQYPIANIQLPIANRQLPITNSQ